MSEMSNERSEMIAAHDAHLRIIQRARHVALVGVSADRRRASFFVLSYLKRTPLILYPINPKYDSISGITCYRSLRDLPVAPDIVDIFRRGDAIPAIVDEAIAVGARAIWLQLGLRHPLAREKAAVANVEYVENRCLKIEYGRWDGRLRAIGANSGIISSKRRRKL